MKNIQNSKTEQVKGYNNLLELLRNKETASFNNCNAKLTLSDDESFVSVELDEEEFSIDINKKNVIQYDNQSFEILIFESNGEVNSDIIEFNV